MQYSLEQQHIMAFRNDCTYDVFLFYRINRHRQRNKTNKGGEKKRIGTRTTELAYLLLFRFESVRPLSTVLFHYGFQEKNINFSTVFAKKRLTYFRGVFGSIVRSTVCNTQAQFYDIFIAEQRFVLLGRSSKNVKPSSGRKRVRD